MDNPAVEKGSFPTYLLQLSLLATLEESQSSEPNNKTSTYPPRLGSRTVPVAK